MNLYESYRRKIEKLMQQLREEMINYIDHCLAFDEPLQAERLQSYEIALRLLRQEIDAI